MLAFKSSRTMSAGYIKGLGNSNSKSILNLNFADDTIIFLQADFKMVEALKYLLLSFEEFLGLKINYSKSSLVPLNISDQESIDYATILGCEISNLPITYLGVPLHWKKLRVSD
jgi:hypothetical protein